MWLPIVYQPQTFLGNTNRNTLVTHTFTTPIYARFVRIFPLTWVYHNSMRLELYGCKEGKPVIYILFPAFTVTALYGKILKIFNPSNIFSLAYDAAKMLLTFIQVMGIPRRATFYTCLCFEIELYNIGNRIRPGDLRQSSGNYRKYLLISFENLRRTSSYFRMGSGHLRKSSEFFGSALESSEVLGRSLRIFGVFLHCLNQSECY